MMGQAKAPIANRCWLFAEYLTTAMAQLSLTRTQLCEKTAVSAEFLRGIERGWHDPWAVPEPMMRAIEIVCGPMPLLLRRTNTNLAAEAGVVAAAEPAPAGAGRPAGADDRPPYVLIITDRPVNGMVELRFSDSDGASTLLLHPDAADLIGLDFIRLAATARASDPTAKGA